MRYNRWMEPNTTLPARPPSRKTLWKALLSVVLSVAALACGAAVFNVLASLKQPPASREQTEKTYNVEVFDVERSNLQEIISAFGTARADREVVLSAQVAGEIVEIHPRLKIGQVMRPVGESQRLPGDLLVRIDQKPYRERVRQAENRIAEDQAELEHLQKQEENNEVVLQKAQEDVKTYKAEYDRLRKLYDDGVAAESQVTAARLEMQRYELILVRADNERKLFPLRRKQILSRVETHNADLEVAKLDEGHTDVRPPFEGVLGDVLVEQGQYVRVGDPLVKLIDKTKVEIPIPVTLTDYAKIERKVRGGESPRVELAENETAPARWIGHVVRVAPEADELTRTVKVFVHVENAEQQVPLLPGTFVHARIDGPVLRETLVVPRDAIVGGKAFVASRGRAVERTVVVQRTLQLLAILEDGVQPGEELILTNLDIIHDGARIEIQSHSSLADELKKQRTKVARETLAGGGSRERETGRDRRGDAARG